MKVYYVNRNPQPETGDNEVHVEGCYWLDKISPEHKEHLGIFLNCHSAVAEAKNRGYYNADGCKYCSPACHRS